MGRILQRRVDLINPCDAVCRSTARTLDDRWGEACYMVAIAGDNPQLRQVAFVPFAVMLHLIEQGGAEIGNTEPLRRTGPKPRVSDEATQPLSDEEQGSPLRRYYAAMMKRRPPYPPIEPFIDPAVEAAVEGLQRDLQFQQRVEVRRHGALPPR